jgi:3-hydroxyacyl-[acyl-carrier-protein] dehydratase
MALGEHRYASAADILAALPHRPPFVFIDRVERLFVGREIHALKNVAPADVFGGAAPRLPALYLQECFGQAGLLLVASEPRDDDAPLGVLLGAVDSFESSGDVVLGDTVAIEVRIEKRTSKMAILEGRALVRAEVVARARFTACFFTESASERMGARAPIVAHGQQERSKT